MTGDIERAAMRVAEGLILAAVIVWAGLCFKLPKRERIEVELGPSTMGAIIQHGGAE